MKRIFLLVIAILISKSIFAQDIVTYKIDGRTVTKVEVDALDLSVIKSMNKSVDPDTFNIVLEIMTKNAPADSSGVANGSAEKAAVPSGTVELEDGAAAPELSGVNPITGKKLGTVKGRVIMVNFWATWCAPCVGELRDPEFAALVNKYAGKKGFMFLAVAVDKPASVSKFVGKLGECAYMHDNVFCDPDRNQFHEYAPSGIPRTYVIDSDGRIAFHVTGRCEEKQIRQLDDVIGNLFKSDKAD
ncbi:MAG: TlpA family protein disulfide reductase [Bacteroidales bacterium]|jgi:thiol-disulfide isomerase/thioredoxin|nr:TlpA family protein disulfide reductase [Bacteroidales bacterium]MCI2145390.1 TlpA family protein disulfide reductase [Bacteroidales bacterium]